MCAQHQQQSWGPQVTVPQRARDLGAPQRRVTQTLIVPASRLLQHLQECYSKPAESPDSIKPRIAASRFDKPPETPKLIRTRWLPMSYPMEQKKTSIPYLANSFESVLLLTNRIADLRNTLLTLILHGKLICRFQQKCRNKECRYVHLPALLFTPWNTNVSSQTQRTESPEPRDREQDPKNDRTSCRTAPQPE